MATGSSPSRTSSGPRIRNSIGLLPAPDANGIGCHNQAVTARLPLLKGPGVSCCPTGRTGRSRHRRKMGMHASRHFSWKHRSLGAVALGVAVAAMAAPAALGDGRSPDTLDAVYAVNSTATQDGWYQRAVQQNFAIIDGRSPDTI